MAHALENEGYEVHTQLEEPLGPPLEEEAAMTDDDEREQAFLRRLQAIADDAEEPKKALILKNSHIGGHKFSGNVVVGVFVSARRRASCSFFFVCADIHAAGLGGVVRSRDAARSARGGQDDDLRGQSAARPAARRREPDPSARQGPPIMVTDGRFWCFVIT